MNDDGPLSRLRRSERLTLALTAVYLATLLPVIVLADLVLWLVWGVAMVAVTGYALVAFNRTTAAASDAESESSSGSSDGNESSQSSRG